MNIHENTTVSSILVRFSDGGTFETSATTAAEYLLDSCFIRFLFLCIVLYGTLMYREDISQLDPYYQVLLWIMMFLVTTSWLVFSVSLNLYMVRRGIVSFVFTPALILPMVPINLIAAGFVADLIGADYWLTFPGNIEAIVQNIIAAICFDILHGRYVAPTHPTYLGVDSRKAQPIPQPEAEEKRIPPAQVTSTPTERSEPVPTVPETVANDTQRPEFVINIAGERLEARKIVYVQSEDHYLKIQQSQTVLLLRGKLKETVKQLDHRLGIQINRSVWIAFSSISDIAENDAGYLQVTLKDDTTFKITNSRKLTFLQNYKLFGGKVLV